jgi:hypothetical protein
MPDDIAPPIAPDVTAAQFPVAGDEILIRATFMRISIDGVHVKINLPTKLSGMAGPPFQCVVVDPASVFAQLRAVDVLKAYGQA